jgi:hypothetical protein
MNENETEVTQESPKPELNLNDLAAIRSLIEVVTQRGAFKANELSSVGVLFDKINAFLEAAQAAQSKTPEGE